MKKNIIFVMDTLRMGGAEKSLVSLLKAIDKNRVNVDLFLFETGGVLQSEVPEWIHVIEADPITRVMTLEIRNYLKDAIKLRKLAAVFDRLRITVNSRLSKKSLFSWGIIKRHIPVLKKKYDVAIGGLEGFTDFFVIDKIKADKKIGWIHSDFTERRLLEEEIQYYGRFDELVTISEVCKNAFLQIIPQVELKLHVLENIVLKEDVCQKSSKGVEEWDKNKKWHMVSVGRLDHVKGIDVAAKVASILKKRGYSFCWHVYGQGILKEEIERYIAQESLEDCFILEGLRENPYPYMRRADIIVQPSRWEGKSLVLDEAKILGKAIVVTNYPSVTDQITHEETGIITGMNPEDIAEGIARLLEDSELKMRLENNAKNEPNKSYQMLETFYQLIGV